MERKRERERERERGGGGGEKWPTIQSKSPTDWFALGINLIQNKKKIIKKEIMTRALTSREPSMP